MIKKSGIIERNEAWAGDVFVEGDIVIPENVAVEIAAGCRISFAPVSAYNSEVKQGATGALNGESWLVEKFKVDGCYFVVKGLLKVSGDRGNPVIIGHEGWDGGMLFFSPNECMIKHARITHASYAVCNFDKSKTIISNSEIAYNKVGIMCVGKGITSLLENNVVQHNAAGIISFSTEPDGGGNDVRIAGNYIGENTGNGIYCSWENPVVSGNRIVRNVIGIKQVGCVKSKIEGNEIAENKIGIYSSEIGSAEISNNKLHRNAETAVLNGEITRVAISNNEMVGNAKAVECIDVGEGEVNGNTVAHGDLGMVFKGQMKGKIGGNNVHAVAHACIECREAAELEFAGNRFVDAAKGIECDGRSRIVLADTLIHSDKACIESGGLSSVHAAGNDLTSKSDVCVQFGMGASGLMERNRIMGVGGIEAKGTCSVRVSWCVIAADKTGIKYSEQSGGAAEGNKIEGKDVQRTVGIEVDGVAETEIRGNRIRGVRSGILCAGEARATIEGNALSAGKTGVRCTDQTGGRIRNNKIEGEDANETVGVELRDVAEFEVQANEINKVQDGVVCAGEARATVEGNVISAVKTGINCIERSSGIIKDNRIRRASATGGADSTRK